MLRTPGRRGPSHHRRPRPPPVTSSHLPHPVSGALGGTAARTSATLGAGVDAAERCLQPDQEVSRLQTPLLGVPARTHNLHLAADYIDGDVIAPGETYSLNQGTGRRTQARGLREVEDGCIGAGGEPVDCVGGGVSQLETFMYAWFAGVDLVESASTASVSRALPRGDPELGVARREGARESYSWRYRGTGF